MQDGKFSISQAFLIIILGICVLSSTVFADNRSRVAGIVTDADNGEPIIGANVIINNTLLGAATDLEGMFVIINVPVGKYDIEVSMIGYQTVVQK